MAYDRYPHTFEAVVQYRSARSWLIEMTLGGRYFLPFKCTPFGDDGQFIPQPDIDGNIVFEVNDWWWKKKDDFEVTE